MFGTPKNIWRQRKLRGRDPPCMPVRPHIVIQMTWNWATQMPHKWTVFITVQWRDNRLWNTMGRHKVMNKPPLRTRDETYQHRHEWKEQDTKNTYIWFVLHKTQVLIRQVRSQHDGYLWAGKAWGRGQRASKVSALFNVIPSWMEES